MRDTGLRFVNFLLHFTVVLCLALACRAQGASNIPNTISIQASGAPSGACGNNFVYTNSATNDFYNCVAGAWNKVTSAGGGSVSLTATTPVVMTPSPTTGTGVASCPTCLTGTTPTNHGVLLGAGTQAPGVTAAGTTGQVLTGVTGADPTWQSAASGALVQLETHTASTSATLDFTACFSSSYHQYLIIAKNLLPATNSVQALLRFSTNGGSTYDATTGVYDSDALVFDVGGVSTEVAVDTNNQSIQLGWQSLPNTAANGGVSYKFTIYDPLNGANAKVNIQGDQQYWGTKTESGIFGASYHSSAAVNAFRILFSSGNITSGVVTCYGITP